jgi:hypothetical protein
LGLVSQTIFPHFQKSEELKRLNEFWKVDAIASGDHAAAFEVFTARIQDGFKLHTDGIRAS